MRLAVIARHYIAVYEGRRQIAAYVKDPADWVSPEFLEELRTAPETTHEPEEA